MAMGLSTSDVEGLAETLSAGKHPKVVFTDAAGQISGKVGKVVRMTRPAEGDFVVVAFGNDELPFTTEEVRVPARGELNRKPAAKKKTDAPAATGAPLLADKPSPAASARDNDRTVNARIGKEKPSMNEPAQPQPAAVPKQSDGGEAAAAPRKKTAKAKQAPELTVTLAWKDGEWSVSASKGTKVIAKPVPVKAATAVSMVQSLDSPAVAAVVEDIVEQQRREVAEQTERLREELAAAEARLAELA
ncbi:MAG: hypothetical protein ACRD0P_35260 [Stackebrandtia sp.]